MSANVRHSSESVEHYTPKEIVEPARRVLERIDLDPASSPEANETVQASAFYTCGVGIRSGRRKGWGGRVFLNPPGGRSDVNDHPVKERCGERGTCGLEAPHKHEGVESSQKKWWWRLSRAWETREIEAAIFVGFSLEILQTTQVDVPKGMSGGPARGPLDFPMCFPKTRVKYNKLENGIVRPSTSPPHASVIVLLPSTEPVGDGSMIDRFVQEFSMIGKVVVPVFGLA